MRDYDIEIAAMAKQLRIGNHILSVYKEVSATEPAEFVYRLLEGLIEKRAVERGLRYRQKAGFESIKLLKDFEFDNIVMAQGFSVEWLKACQFVRDKQNLILIGNPGTGKTHLATALGVKECDDGGSVLFYRTSKLVQYLVELHETNQMERFWKQLEGCRMLILDEWGFIPIHQTGTRLLFEVIADCYEKRSIVVTTNLPPAEWNRILGDERLAVAIMDRLFHHGLLIRHTGDSYRQSHSLMRECA